MRFDRDQLVFKALCALDEAADACHAGPVKPTFALRFALAFLYAVSDGRRDPYDDFWREIGDSKETAYSADAGRYIRSSYARTALTAIARGVGVEMSIEIMQRLSAVRKRSGS